MLVYPATVVLKVVQLLDEKFGHTVNEKGYKVLHPSVRVIQGDGVNELSINTILTRLAGHGYSADNVGFGMGGALLQGINRDTNKWAMKCSAVEIDGVWHDVFKDPITDPGKQSKKGRLELVQDGPAIFTVRREDYNEEHQTKLLRTVWKDGTLLVDEDFDTIRARTLA